MQGELVQDHVHGFQMSMVLGRGASSPIPLRIPAVILFPEQYYCWNLCVS